MQELDSFQEILAAARLGDEEAWRRIYREQAPPVLGYLRARGAPEPEDLLGEVFLQAVRDLDRFEGGRRELRAWLLTIAHHRLLDERRRRERRPAEPVPPEHLTGHGAVGDAETEAIGRLDEGEVRELIAALSDDQQAVVLLRVLGGLTVAEVARVLGKRQGAVKALQRRGLAQIRETLEGRRA